MSNFIKQWTQKEVEGLTRSFKRYSLYVIILKFVLPITALILAAILFLYPAMTGSGKKIVLVAHDKKDIKPQVSPVMAKPKFIGTDSKNQPFQITAQRAIQEKVDFTRLEKITGDMTLENGTWISGVADHGSYDSASHFVKLDDEVTFYMVQPDNTSYQALTKDVSVDMQNGTMKSSNPIQITFDSGTLRAEKFDIDREKKKITFQGNVKLVILKK